jgi:PIN domain nuclease of toxin-antitoxin system
LLLDTHVLIWFAEGTADLGRPQRELIDRSAAADGLSVSAISFWEVAMLAERGRLSLAQPVDVWRSRVLAAPGVVEAPVTGEVGIESVRLPGGLHDDPADRMIAATARLNGWRLATRDKRLIAYGKAGHARVVAV